MSKIYNDVKWYIKEGYKDLRTTLELFKQFNSEKKTSVLAITLLGSLMLGTCGAGAGIAGGLCLFRCAVMSIKSGGVIDQLFKRTHPVEKASTGPFIQMPDELIRVILEQCDAATLRTAQRTCKKMFDHSEAIWEMKAKQLLGGPLANILKQGRPYWGSVINAIEQPFKLTSNIFSQLEVNNNSGFFRARFRSKLEDIYRCSGESDTDALQKALENLKAEVKDPRIFCDCINASFFGTTPLVAAASRGCLDNMKLLVKYGARDVKGVDASGHINVWHHSPFFVAMLHKQVDVVKYLLENGWRFRPAHPIHVIMEFLDRFILQDKKSFECMLLVLKALETMKNPQDAIKILSKRLIELGEHNYLQLIKALGYSTEGEPKNPLRSN